MIYCPFTHYEYICAENVDKCVSKCQVSFADEGELGSFSEWYSIFCRSEPEILHKGGEDNIICFEEGQTGLVTDSMWFQYGLGSHKNLLLIHNLMEID